MKYLLFKASAIALGVGVLSAPAFAQEAEAGQAAPSDQATPNEPQATADRVVVTGSFIRGTPEDAALPVEVYSAEELEEQGAPTALEFAKSLSITGPIAGEANFFAGAGGTGNVQYNIRGIGADKTLTLLNGRRVSENTSNIPAIALARTEILKDGAAVIYGADATGGVINFITRDDFRGFEARASYKYIDGSDGDYGIGVLGGFGSDSANFMWSAEWEHRSQLDTSERSFSRPNSILNPSQTSFITDLSRYVPVGARPTVPGANANTSSFGEFGAALGGSVADFTTASCNAVGGVVNPTSSGGTSCDYNFIPYYNLVEENEIYRVYTQFNATLNDNVDFHAEASYGKVETPKAYGSPSFPTTRGPARTTGASLQYFVPRTNPGAADFLQRSGLGASAIAPAIQGFVPVLFRPLGFAGNPVFGDGKGFGSARFIQDDVFRISADLKGNLGDAFGPLSDVGFDFAVTYNQATGTSTNPEILGFRLQDALSGFGGPNCNVADENPLQFGIQNNTVGTSVAARAALGCQYFNPFASNFAAQPELRLANPNHVPGLENSPELIRWLFDDGVVNDFSDSLTVDLVFNGETPLALPGGNISLAAGTQWRQLQAETRVPSPFYNFDVPCSNPGTTGVLLPDGPDAGTDPDVVPVSQIPLFTNDPRYTGCGPFPEGPFTFFSPVQESDNDRQQYSLFLEAQIPVFDNLNFQAAVRREEFSGNLEETVYKIAGKWDVWGPFSIRGAFGTNYQAPPVGLVPGQITNNVASISVAGNSFRGTSVVTRDDIVPETAEVTSFGAIWDSRGIATDHDFRLIVDYFKIETEDELGVLASVNQVATAVFSNPDGTLRTTANCASPFANRILFNQGTCAATPNATFLGSDIAVVSTDFGNGPNQTTSGFDVQVQYSLPFLSGDLTFDATATILDKIFYGPTSLDGVQIANRVERLGQRNVNDGGGAAPEVRANGSINYRLDRHNFRFGANFVSGVVDERGPVPQLGQTAASGILTTYGVNAKDYLTFDFTYLFDLTDDTRLTLSLDNITDRDPPAARQEFGYDPFIADPLGRTIEVSIKHQF